ncbi:hypothetical protein Srot_0058 [Segniliparus rotundus DSM 44985]|uniref:Uncharacterized protein n=1 Tax=Segniliparus rotundus (strain ATCC BAA-972 / CDC 1076 / CIP 108378 / DSM 44985 / JCM 13578) TaxID=640132 RepID=D6Z9M4_SEGRD|nr:hypothetical protein [Segniliparus rotundus]ADG96551.1 hypothetical protein Srot_0058 [Segniliparus rotundus DSM 44985]
MSKRIAPSRPGVDFLIDGELHKVPRSAMLEPYGAARLQDGSMVYRFMAERLPPGLTEAVKNSAHAVNIREHDAIRGHGTLRYTEPLWVTTVVEERGVTTFKAVFTQIERHILGWPTRDLWVSAQAAPVSCRPRGGCSSRRGLWPRSLVGPFRALGTRSC